MGAAMIAVIFEVEPQAQRGERYFEIAAGLRAALEEIDGFISVERFQSLSRPGCFLSLSFWRDEQAVRRWRNEAAHREAQREGRASVFAGYRLRVAQVLRDYGFTAREQAPDDSRRELA